MPDIDPAALSRSASGAQPSSTPLAPVKSISNSTPASQKPTKSTSSSGQRIDLEPLYTPLKAAVGEHWVAYKEAISLFILGHLNQTELAARIDHFITSDASIIHLHNQLISAIYGNVTRDLPDQGVASWVSANDKPTTVAKPVSGDAAEQRLKTEVMQLPARDRRRIKDIPEPDPSDTSSNSLTEYHQAKQIKPPDLVPTSAGGMNKTNWDLEIRKRYSQPLAIETGEFPDTDIIHNRMVPICYEEGVVSGAGDDTAPLLTVATEVFVREVLSSIFSRTRSNGRNYVSTSAFKRQLEDEGNSWLRGDLEKNSSSLLPIEQAAGSNRPPLTSSDLRLALRLGDDFLDQMPLTVAKINGDYLDGELKVHDDSDDDLDFSDHEGDVVMTNGVHPLNGAFGDDPSIDESDWGWEGGGLVDREGLGQLLDERLAVGE
ncbi:MAG: transcriptional coactivator hfi1/ADA1 [Chaenotheca gracillima]|nr:MAG: transcriptional coactivator hfi1/ADA1 [Chaenotheca gracillima]